MRKLLASLSVLCILASCDTLEEVITGQESAPEEILGIQQWRCISLIDWMQAESGGGFRDHEIIVRLSRPRDKEAGLGEITVAGTTHTAFFRVEGLSLRWSFGEDSRYSLIIEPDGLSGYYDFSGVDVGEKILPTQRYGCKAWK